MSLDVLSLETSLDESVEESFEELVDELSLEVSLEELLEVSLEVVLEEFELLSSLSVDVSSDETGKSFWSAFSTKI